MTQLEQTIERQYESIEPGWSLKQEELIKNMQVPGKGYNPIEPESGFPKLHHKILKNILKNNSFPKHFGFLMFAPGSAIYSAHKIDDIQREIAQEEGREFSSMKSNKSHISTYYILEVVKIPLAYHLSQFVSKFIW